MEETNRQELIQWLEEQVAFCDEEIAALEQTLKSLDSKLRRRLDPSFIRETSYAALNKRSYPSEILHERFRNMCYLDAALVILDESTEPLTAEGVALKLVISQQPIYFARVLASLSGILREALRSGIVERKANAYCLSDAVTVAPEDCDPDVLEMQEELEAVRADRERFANLASLLKRDGVTISNWKATTVTPREVFKPEYQLMSYRQMIDAVLKNSNKAMGLSEIVRAVLVEGNRNETFDRIEKNFCSCLSNRAQNMNWVKVGYGRYKYKSAS